MSIKLRTIWLAVALVVLLKPPLVVVSPILNSVFDYMQVMVVLMLVPVSLQRGMGLYAKILTAAFSLFLMSTVLKGGSLTDCARFILPCYGIVLLFDGAWRRGDSSPLHMLKVILTCYIVINLVTIICFPHGVATMTAIDGATTVPLWFLGQKNVQIRYVLPYLYVLLYSRWLRKSNPLSSSTICGIVVATACVILTASLNGFIGIAAATLVFVLAHRKAGVAQWLLRPVPLFVALLLLTYGVVTKYYLFTGLLSPFGSKDIYTASARIYVWNAAIALIREHWLLGMGATKFASTLGWWVSHPHNFVMYLWLRGGIVALALVLYALFDALCLSNHNLASTGGQLLLAYLVAILVMGIAESLTEFPLLFMPLVLGEYTLSRHRRRARWLRTASASTERGSSSRWPGVRHALCGSDALAR